LKGPLLNGSIRRSNLRTKTKPQAVATAAAQCTEPVSCLREPRCQPAASVVCFGAPLRAQASVTCGMQIAERIEDRSSLSFPIHPDPAPGDRVITFIKSFITMTSLQSRFRSRLFAALAATVLAGSAAWAPSALAATAAQVKAAGSIAVATEDDFKPFEFVDNGVPTGYDNELLAMMRKVIGIEVKQQILPWPGILPGVTTGKFDMALTAVLVTPERKATFDFTMPLAESTTYFATKKGSPIATAEGLAGKVVGAQTGSAMLADLKAMNAAMIAKGGKGVKEIIEYQSYPEAYQDLGIGRLDAVVNTQINLNSLVATKADTFVVGKSIGKPVYIAWAVKKGNEGVLAVVNAALAELKKNGQMAALQKKWLGTSFDKMPASVD
jgi:polar amino acid transport system substrate-binding protein